MLDRELSEVHLLLDYISACPQKALPPNLSQDTNSTQPDNWLEKLCQITWPPSQDSDTPDAQAALLLRAKDVLNRIAQPASGATIAYTLLVAQEATPKKNEELPRGDPSSRLSLAITAYPGLVKNALDFKTWTANLCYTIIAFLVFTVFLSGYVAFGNTLLVQYADAHKSLVVTQDKIDSYESSLGKPPSPTISTDTVPPKQNSQSAQSAADPTQSPICSGNPDTSIKSLGFLGPQSPIHSAIERQLCPNNWRSAVDLETAAIKLRKWQFSKYDSSEVEAEPSAYSSASAWASLLGTSVLPFLYGLLGGGASIVRAISRKISTSQLAPRDLTISFQQLALAAVVGACIGLFISPQTTSGGTGASLLGPVTLSVSALSFIAGFGVEGVFRAMEALINRVFGGGAGQSQGAPMPTK